MSSAKERAREYYSRHWLPIPLKKNSKAPNLPKGHEFLYRIPTKGEFAEFQWYNVGVVCGEISGITVLDVDEPEGSDTLERMQLSIPLTPQVETPNGRHHIFNYDPLVKTGVAVVGKGVDVRNDGSFIVGVGSEVEGREYRWFVTPEEVEMANPPEWMRSKGSNGSRKTYNGNADLSKRLGEGNRNSGLTSIAGKLLYGGTMEEGLVYNVLSICNSELCDPPLEEWEVESIFKSIRRYNYEN